MGERFRVGRVVARSFAIWGRGLPLLVALSLAVQVPRVVSMRCLDLARPAYPMVESRLDSTPEEREASREASRRWFATFVAFSFGADLLHDAWTSLAVGLIALAVHARLEGRPARFLACVRGGLRRFRPILRVALLFFAVDAIPIGLGLITGVTMPVWIFASAVRAANVLLLSPFCVAVPAAALDDPPMPVRRSWRLTRGRRLAVLAVLLLLEAIDWGSVRLLRLPFPMRSDSPEVVWWTRQVLFVSLAAVFAAVTYHALRLEKEGQDVPGLERVFA